MSGTQSSARKRSSVARSPSKPAFFVVVKVWSRWAADKTFFTKQLVSKSLMAKRSFCRRTSSFDSGGSITKLMQSDCAALIEKLIGVSSEEILFPGVKRFSRSLPRTRSVLLWVVFILAFVLFTGDMADIASGGEYQETPFGKTNPMISLMGFCSSQITILMAVVGIGFLLKNGKRLLQCGKILDQMVVTFEKYIPHRGLAYHKTYTKRYIMAVLMCGFGRYASSLCQPNVIYNFWDNSTYVWLPFPRGATIVYNEGCMMLAMLCSVPVTAIFTYFSALFVQCVEGFSAENDALCETLRSSKVAAVETVKQAEDNEKHRRVVNDSFTASLKLLRVHHEDLNDAYDLLQETFSVKMLLDLLTNLFGLLSVIAWFTLWSVNKWLATVITGFWHALSLLIYVVTIWMVVAKPLELQKKHRIMVDTIEKLLFQRQMLAVAKSTRDEIVITFALRQRLRSKILSFSAGGILDMHHSALTCVAGLGGFIAFMCERVENIHSKDIGDPNMVADILNANASCEH